MVLHCGQHRGCGKLAGVQQKGLHPAISFVEAMLQLPWLRTLLLQDVDVHQVLSGLFKVDELFLQTCANKKWIAYTLRPTTTKTYGR
jgi:hypothetical protein